MNSPSSENDPLKRVARKAKALDLYKEAVAIAGETFKISPEASTTEKNSSEHQRRILAKAVGGTLIKKEAAHREDVEQAIAEGERDPLTNAYNRRGLQSELVKELARLRRIRKQNQVIPSDLKAESSILYIDVNDLKFVNDSFGGGKRGHAAGDRLLQRVVLVLQEASRTGDIVARLGGDEFVLVLAGADVDDALKFVEERIKPQNINVSIGIAPLDEQNPWKSIEKADAAMYKGKRAYKQSDKNEPMVAGRRLSG